MSKILIILPSNKRCRWDRISRLRRDLPSQRQIYSIQSPLRVDPPSSLNQWERESEDGIENRSQSRWAWERFLITEFQESNPAWNKAETLQRWQVIRRSMSSPTHKLLKSSDGSHDQLHWRLFSNFVDFFFKNVTQIPSQANFPSQSMNECKDNNGTHTKKSSAAVSYTKRYSSKSSQTLVISFHALLHCIASLTNESFLLHAVNPMDKCGSSSFEATISDPTQAHQAGNKVSVLRF